MKNVTRGKVLAAAVILFAVVMCGYLYHDLHLSDEGGQANLPDVVIENIRINREVNGRKWLFTSPRVEHKDGVIYGTSLDVTITEKNGAKSRLKAGRGQFTRENSDITLIRTNGTVMSHGKPYSVASGHALYTASGDLWNFSDNFMLSGENVTVKCLKGSFNTNNGECRITDGGKVIWNLK